MQGLFAGVQITLAPTVLKPLWAQGTLPASPLGQRLGEEKGLLRQLCFFFPNHYFIYQQFKFTIAFLKWNRYNRDMNCFK